jgi:hypothetical protein
VKRALDEHWPIPKKLRLVVIRRLTEVIEDTGSSPREVTSAAKAILSASKLNLEGIAAIIKADEHEDLQARVQALEAEVGNSPPRRIIIPDGDTCYEQPSNSNLAS